MAAAVVVVVMVRNLQVVPDLKVAMAGQVYFKGPVVVVVQPRKMVMQAVVLRVGQGIMYLTA
jgi:hypothetical protein